MIKNKEILIAIGIIILAAAYGVAIARDINLSTLTSKTPWSNKAKGNDYPDFSRDVLYPSNPDDFSKRNPVDFPVPEQETADYSNYYIDTITQERVEWLKHPEPLGNIGLVNLKHSSDYYTLQYYKIGTDRGYDIVVTAVPCDGICFSDDYGVFVSYNNGFYLLTKHTDDYFREAVTLSPGVEENDDILYPALDAPTTLQAGEDVLVSRNRIFFSDTKRWRGELSFETQTEYGPLFRTSYPHGKESLTNLVENVLRLPGGVGVIYYTKFVFKTDDGVPQIVWADGTINEDAYRGDGLGACGSGGSIDVISDGAIDDSDLKIIGVIPSTGKFVYGFTHLEHPLVRRFYETTGGQSYLYDPSTRTGIAAQYTIQDVIDRHMLFVYKDFFNRYVLFSSTRYGPPVECAKPVIYLYPESRIDVSIKIVADITQSEPLYNNGWSVIANPDGTLELDGIIYHSLYWDGMGKGPYPAIRQGSVVKRSDIEHTLKNHLVSLGLNEQERAEFLDYWLPLMPETPYVRLSWLGTREMDALAPLSVFPSPDTHIRVFLDFEGLNEFQDIPPQKLGSIPREGFTLVEWGGLRR